jgi:hypothetical protein
MFKKYQINKASVVSQITGDWNGPAWGGVEVLDINNFMGAEPVHKPKTQAKVVYDANYLYVIFRVEDKYVMATAEKNQTTVCWDSCVEFFFTPNEDVSNGYFNFEMNCGGTILLYFQKARSVAQTVVNETDLEKIKIYHSEPEIVNPEKKEATTWIVEYRIPFEVLAKYSPVIKPAKKVVWRGNFYKCADRTSSPHWLTWSPIGCATPNFHLPQFFGELEFN